MVSRFIQTCSSIGLLFAAAALSAAEGGYVDIGTDLRSGTDVPAAARKAYDNRDGYWDRVRSQPRPDGGLPSGDDEALSAGQAVAELYHAAVSDPRAATSSQADIVHIVTAVIDAWPDCEDTADSVRAAVTLMPERADEIIATVAVKRDCNCDNGGIWLDERLEERLMPELRRFILEAPFMCSCSQAAMLGGISGLPETREFKPDMSAAQKAALIERMTERVQVITDRTAALQSRNGWECGCTDINIAASMQGIGQVELRDGTFDGLARKYAEEVGDRGLVVDAFGMVGLTPAAYWGEGTTTSRDNTLRRDPQVFRGDPLILDAFDPAAEFTGFGQRGFEGLGRHEFRSDQDPVDVFLSEYIEGRSDEAEQRNRALELYNGTGEPIDLSMGQYLLEIHGPGGAAASHAERPRQVLGLNGTIEPGETFVLAYNGSDDAITSRAQLLTPQLDFAPNETLVLRRLGGEMALYCRAHSYAYVTHYPPDPFIRRPVSSRSFPLGHDELASPN